MWKIIDCIEDEDTGYKETTKVADTGDTSVVLQTIIQKRNLDGTMSISNSMTTLDNVRVVHIKNKGYRIKPVIRSV